MTLYITNSYVVGWSSGNNLFSASDPNLKKITNTTHDIEGEWYEYIDEKDTSVNMKHMYIKDNFWIEFAKSADGTQQHPSIRGGLYNHVKNNDYPYELQLQFYSNEPGATITSNVNDIYYFRLDNFELVSPMGQFFSRERYFPQKRESKIFQLQKLQFNLKGSSKLVSVQINIEFSIENNIENDELLDFKENELIGLNAIIYNHLSEIPNLSFSNYGHSQLIHLLNIYFNKKRIDSPHYEMIYPADPFEGIIPKTLLITDLMINPKVLPTFDLGKYSPINLVDDNDFTPGKYTLKIDDLYNSFEINSDGTFKIKTNNFISEKNISGTWWINSNLIIFEGSQVGEVDVIQLEFNKLNRQLIKVIRNGENILVKDNLQSVYLIYEEIQNTKLLPYNFNNPILVNIIGEGGIVLSTEIGLLIKCVDNVDSGRLQEDLDQYKNYLIDICRSYLADIHKDDLNLELIHKEELIKRINMSLNEILENSVHLRKSLMLNPIQKVLFKSYVYQ